MVHSGFLMCLDALEVSPLEVVEDVSVDKPLPLAVSRQGHFASSSFSSTGSLFTSAAVKFKAAMFDL